MTLRLAIIADDLTGALDTATPFVLAGLRTAVAVGLEGIDAALASGASVVAVNTASRDLGPAEAAERAGRACRALLAAGPAILFKKIDSRLKGNPGAEAHAMAEAGGRGRLVVAPAIPDQMRLTRGGAVVGRGVPAPIAIAPAFADAARPAVVIDAAGQGELDDLAAATDWSGVVAVGARGLGLAFARLLGGPAVVPAFRPTESSLFAIGSRDPITAAQIDRLIAGGRLAAVVDAPDGALAVDGPLALPALVRCTGAIGPDPQAVAERFAAAVAGLIAAAPPALLMLGGGDTALSVLRALGIGLLLPRGEIEAGVPWFDIVTRNGAALACSVKSGGFGTSETLAAVLGRSARPIDDETPRAGVSP